MFSRIHAALLFLFVAVFFPAAEGRKARKATKHLRRRDDPEDAEDTDSAVEVNSSSYNRGVVNMAASADDGDDDDDDDEDEDEEPAAAVPVSVAPGTSDEKTLMQSEVHEAHEKLAENLREQVETNAEIKELDDVEKSHAQIDASVVAVEKETQSKAMASFLGDMWKEMRMFAKPFYKEHLEEKLAKLERKTPGLATNFSKAQAKLTSWDPSLRVVDNLDPKIAVNEGA